MKKFYVLIGLVICTLVVRHIWYVRGLEPYDVNNKEYVTFVVEKGSSLQTIARSLEEKNLIRSATAFTKYNKKHDQAKNMQAGTFRLQPSMNVEGISTALLHGKSTEVSITIPEGYTVTDIDALLVKEGLLSAGQFTQAAASCYSTLFTFMVAMPNVLDRSGCTEGYLYPDTYFVRTEGFTAEKFVMRLLETFEKKAIEPNRDLIEKSGKTLHEIVTMASLVEEETRRSAERPIVAGILWKRLDEGISLGIDATVRYLVNKPTAPLTVTDLQQDSPYNTRRYLGLPPGPIASPSLNSLRATLQPESSPYYYYLHDASGTIRYAETNDEHNRNKQKYL